MPVMVLTEREVSTPTYNVMSNIMLRGKQPAPEIGMGATVCYAKDRHAATVTAIETFKTGTRKGQVKAVTVQQDKATRTDKNGMSDSQSYEYERDENGRTWTFKVNKAGKFGVEGIALFVGTCDEFYDYTF